MRTWIASSVAVLALSSVAHAESGASFDLGYVRSRVAVTDQTALSAELARFAIKITRGRLHVGAEAEEGRLSGSTGRSDGSVARTSTGEPLPDAGPLEGNTLGLKLFVGTHANVGRRFLVGADLAGGMRDSWVSSDLGPDVAGRKNEPLLEVRSRVDFFLSPSWTLGGVASSDLIERRNVALALVLSLHCMR